MVRKSGEDAGEVYDLGNYSNPDCHSLTGGGGTSGRGCGDVELLP